MTRTGVLASPSHQEGRRGVFYGSRVPDYIARTILRPPVGLPIHLEDTMDEFTNDLSNEERETHLSMTGDNHKEWEIFTDDPYWVRRLDKFAEGQPVGKGKKYRLQANQVTIRAVPKRRELSDEERQQISERFRAMREKS